MAKKTEQKPQPLLNPEDRLLKPTHKERLEAVPTSEYGRGDIVAPFERLVQGSQASGLGDSASPLLQQQQYVLPEHQRVEGEEREEYGKGEIITPQEKLIPSSESEIGGDSESPLMRGQLQGEAEKAKGQLAIDTLDKCEIPEYCKGQLKICLVDGGYIQVHQELYPGCEEFEGCGNYREYEWIPDGEIWVDKNQPEIGQKLSILYHLAKVNAMEGGMTKEDAEIYAANIETSRVKEYPEEVGGLIDVEMGKWDARHRVQSFSEINNEVAEKLGAYNDENLIPSDAELVGDYNRLPTLTDAALEVEEEKETPKAKLAKRLRKKRKPVETGSFPDRYYLGHKLRPTETSLEL